MGMNWPRVRHQSKEFAITAGLGLGAVFVAVVAAWLLWLGVSAFLLYGYQSIVWILS